MKKRQEYAWIILLLILCASNVIADPPLPRNNADGSTTWDYTEATFNDFDSWPTTAKQGLTGDQISEHWDVLKDKESQLNPKAYSDAASKQTGTKANIDTSKGDVGGEPLPDGQGMTFQQLPAAQFNNVILTNAKQVTVTPTSTCGAQADSVLVGADLHANVRDFCVRGNKVDVKHADEVRVKCGVDGYTWMTTDVNDATFVVDESVRLNTSTAQSLAITDCLGNNVGLNLSADGQSDFTKNGSQITAEKVALMLGGDVVWAEGLSKVVLDKESHKVIFVDAQPVFTYRVATGSPATDFAVRIEDVPAQLFIKRADSDTVPPEMTTCADCAVLDLVGRTLTVHGRIEYLRNFVDKTGKVLANDVVAFKGMAGSAATLTFDPTLLMADVAVETGEATANISNYLQLAEKNAGNEGIHTFLGVNENIKLEGLSVPVVRSYRAAHSPAVAVVGEDNLLNYSIATEAFEALVLPPSHPLIAVQQKRLDDGNKLLLERMAGYSGAVLASLLPLFLFRRKKGQLSVFILLGAVIVIMVGFVFYLQSGVNNPALSPDDSLQQMANACFKSEAADTLKAVEAAGLNPSTNDAENAISKIIEGRAKYCFDKMQTLPSAGTLKDATAKVKTTIGQDKVTFRVDYPVRITRASGTLQLASMAFEIPQRLLLMMSSDHYLPSTHNRLIDLDTIRLPNGEIIFFPGTHSPGNDGLKATIEDKEYAQKGGDALLGKNIG